MDKNDYDMLESCFTYGYIGWSSYYNDLVKKYGIRKIKAHLKILERDYKIIKNVYTDVEGCSYNSLVLK